MAVAEVLLSPGAILTVVLLFAVLFLYAKFYYLPFRVLKRNGFHGPTPSFFYGNYKDSPEMGFMEYLKMMHEKYGPIVGFYFGQQANLSVMDVDLIKFIAIKDFNYFFNRAFPPDIINTGSIQGLLRARDEQWRLARQALSPTFSSFKMKAMAPLIQSSVDTLVEVIQSHADKDHSLEVFRIFGSFTLETIFATAFGRVIDLQRGHSDQLTEAAATLFSANEQGKKTSYSFLTTILSNFPLAKYYFQFMFKGSKQEMSFRILKETASKLIQQRREDNTPGKYKDLLQLMIEATVDDKEENNSRKLTNEMITIHSITFMLAGYESTASTLSYTCYLLALHPHIQEKLQTEIDNFYSENPETSPYQAAQDLDYLDMVLQESMRVYPAVPVFLRECNKDYKYKDMTIPKGCTVMIPSSLLQMSPEYWKDPEIFDPLRFTQEEKSQRPPQCYSPFGSGPRGCLGMRFAFLEAKIALIELLKRFTFTRAPDTQVPLETVFGITMSPKNGVHLKIVSRM